MPFFLGPACQVWLSYCPKARDRPRPPQLPFHYHNTAATTQSNSIAVLASKFQTGFENELFQPHGLRRDFVALAQTPRTPKTPHAPGFSLMASCARPLTCVLRSHQALRGLSMQPIAGCLSSTVPKGASPEGRLPSARHRPDAVALKVKPYCFVLHTQKTCLTSDVFFNLTNRYCTFSH